MNSAKVSIIIPSYNHEPYISALIDSIYAQSYLNFELIVLDDGSKDGSPALLKELQTKFNFKLILKENEGLCATLNHGIELATGKYIINIGSDDIMVRNRLKEQVEYMESHPEVDVVGGGMFLIDVVGKECGIRIPAVSGNISFEKMIMTNRLFAPTVMIRKTVFDKYGLYPKDYLLEDYYLWLKVLNNRGVVHNVDSFWVYYRISNVNLEKKFNWYFQGAQQALSPYAQNAIVKKQMHRNVFLFTVKLGLLLGFKAREKYREYFDQLNLFENLVSFAVILTPKFVRDLILIKLKLKT